MISIAILPFKNISANNENEYICDGITEEIINALGRIDQLKVTSRISSFYYKNHTAPLAEIGEKLNVKIILEGSIQVANNKIRIRTHLINVQEDTPFWSESWDRIMDDIFKIQDDISLLIADKLREFVGHLDISDHLVESKTQSAVAYEYLLKGRYHFYKWNPEDTSLAISYFDKALELDKNLIDGYLGLADSYSFMAVAGFAPRMEAWAKATQAIEAAKKINPEHAGLNYMLGHQAFFTAGDFKKAMEYGLKAISHKPTYAEAHCFMAFLYTINGDLKKSKEHILYAKSIDPLNPETRFFEANFLYRSEEYEKADSILDSLIQDNNKNLPAIIVHAYIKIHNKKGKEAREFINAVPEELIMPDERLGLICLSYLADNLTDTHYLSELEQRAAAPTAHQAHSYLFIIYALLGRNDEAFQVLEHLFKSKSSILLLGFSDPLAKKIREDERYSGYHERVYTRLAESTVPRQKNVSKLDESTIKSLTEKIFAYLESETPYLDPSLSLRSLADQTEVHPNKLSFLLNEHIGKNFNEFINQYRIEHFKKLVTDSANSHISILGLAYESGFNSKTVFNTAFKKEVGITPKEYQKQHS